MNEYSESTIRQNLPLDLLLIRSYRYLGKERVDLGLIGFSRAGRPVKMSLSVGGFEFKRISTGSIPERYAGDVCSCQIYELCDSVIEKKCEHEWVKPYINSDNEFCSKCSKPRVDVLKDALDKTIECLIDSGGDPWEYDSNDIQIIVQYAEKMLKGNKC